jgi:hypothetical protein
MVKGVVDLQLIGKINIALQAVYTTTNKECDKTYNKIEGVRGWRQKDVIFQPNDFSKNGQYEFKIPFDYYQKGFCQWNITSVNDYSGAQANKGYFTLLQFIPCGNSETCSAYLGRVPKNYSLRAYFQNKCYINSKKKFICRASGDSILFSSTSVVSRNNHYTYINNFSMIDEEKGHA